MNITRKFETVASDGKVSLSQKVLVPMPVFVQSATVQIAGSRGEVKSFEISVNGQLVFSGSAPEGSPVTFNPPIKIPFGRPSFDVISVPYRDGERVAGNVTVNVKFG